MKETSIQKVCLIILIFFFLFVFILFSSFFLSKDSVVLWVHVKACEENNICDVNTKRFLNETRDVKSINIILLNKTNCPIRGLNPGHWAHKTHALPTAPMGLQNHYSVLLATCAFVVMLFAGRLITAACFFVPFEIKRTHFALFTTLVCLGGERQVIFFFLLHLDMTTCTVHHQILMPDSMSNRVEIDRIKNTQTVWNCLWFSHIL